MIPHKWLVYWKLQVCLQIQKLCMHKNLYGSCQIDMTTLNPGCLEQAFALTLLHGFSTVRWTTDLQLPVTVIPGVICYDSTTKHGRYMLALNIYMDHGLRKMVSSIISKSDPRVILGSCKW